MRIYVDWIGDHYIDKRIEVEDSQVVAISGFEAMEILFDCCIDKNMMNYSYVVLFCRKDLGGMIPQTAHPSFAVDCFASKNFVWAKVHREYLDKLIGE